MRIKLNEGGKRDVLLEFAKTLGSAIRGRHFYISKEKGGGYISEIQSNEEMKIIVFNFYLNIPSTLERTNVSDEKLIVFSFNDVFDTFEDSGVISQQQKQPNIVICSHKVYSTIDFHANTFFRSIHIATSQGYLQQLFGKIKHPIIERILQNDKHFIFEADVSPNIIKVANDLVTEKTDELLEQLFYKSKANELLCYLFDSLIKRDIGQVSKIHIQDIRALYKLKKHLQQNLDTPPDIAALANQFNMSESKLRYLFRQTFGKNTFEYYQSLRMQEAARLLQKRDLSVTQIGYKLGFSNISHFGRVFEEFFGMKPKKWSAVN